MTWRLPRLRTPRNAEFTSLLETFLIAAIATVLTIRTQLWLTNYPQLGGRGLERAKQRLAIGGGHKHPLGDHVRRVVAAEGL